MVVTILLGGEYVTMITAATATTATTTAAVYLDPLAP
jgi:hypothetical protein